jgi:hypothetical protein
MTLYSLPVSPALGGVQLGWRIIRWPCNFTPSSDRSCHLWSGTAPSSVGIGWKPWRPWRLKVMGPSDAKIEWVHSNPFKQSCAADRMVRGEGPHVIAGFVASLFETSPDSNTTDKMPDRKPDLQCQNICQIYIVKYCQILSNEISDHSMSDKILHRSENKCQKICPI